MAKKSSEDVILTGVARQKEIDNLHKKEWKFPDRSCLKCTAYKCFYGQDAERCDFAKYGCRDYDEK